MSIPLSSCRHMRHAACQRVSVRPCDRPTTSPIAHNLLRANHTGLGSSRKLRPLQRISSLRCAATPPGLQTPPWTGAPNEVQWMQKFGYVPSYLDFRPQALQTLMARFEEFSYGQPSEEEAIWFLRDRNFDPLEAYDKLSATLKWRAEFNIDKITFDRVEREAATGKAYLHKHFDRYQRPALVIRVARHKIGEFTERESQELCIYYIEKAISARPPGVDNVIGIFDLRGFNLNNADFGFVRFLIQAFFFYYPRRAGEVLMVDAPWAFMPPYELMKPLLGKYAQLIRFVSLAEARQYFTAETMPDDFK